MASAVAVLFGLLVDQFSERLIPSGPWRIIFQFVLIFAVVALTQRLLSKLLPFDLVSNVFFISLFLGVQRHLLEEVSSIHLVPLR